MKAIKITFCFYLFIIIAFFQVSILYADNNHIIDNETVKIVTNERIVIPTNDENKNKISDDFEIFLSNQKTDSQMIDVIVALDHSPNHADFSTFEKYGGIVVEIWDDLVYAFHGNIQQRHILDYSLNDGIVLIEKNENITFCLDYSVKQIGVRPTVWDTYGYMGDSSHVIAIIDDGIDDSHTDLSGKIVKWQDFTSDGYPTPSNKGEHGTHCAGIAVGTGAASGTSTKKYTWSDLFNWYSDPPLTTYVTPTKSGTLSLTLWWDDDWGDGDGKALIWIDTNQNGNMDSGEYITGYQPLTYSASVNLGRYMVGVNADDVNASLEDFFCQINVPSQSLDDGRNLLRGVAPNCKLAGLKIFTDTGESSDSILITALNWLAANAQSNNIIVASMSIGGPHSDIVNAAVNNLVSAGIVCVVAAGNSQGGNYIGSPGTAAKAITVGAVADDNKLTDYSSIGDPGQSPIKPDVVAPGGSFNIGDQIISVDSNDADLTSELDPDRYPNDYKAMSGTSMSCPHVAGLAALIADALGTWQYTAERALKVKQIICMTSYEIEAAENTGYTPPFNHGGKDNKEGYGRVCADAAIEAATMTITPSPNTFSFGNQASDKKVWARQVNLEVGKTYTFNMNVPSTGNYDLYLYDKSPNVNGEPVLLAASYNSGSTNEIISYPISQTGTYYIIAKWRSGYGQATITYHGPPPVCDFNYTPPNPTIFDIVSFYDTSNDDSIVSWLWNFGDGATSTQQHPTHTYSQKNTYQVNLTVTDIYGTTNHTSQNLTVINIPPNASFSYSPVNPTSQDVILFTDTSTDPDGDITNWTWDFGDGTSSNLQNTSHKYADDGVYTVTLNVTDDDGALGTKSLFISVSNMPPVANFSYLPANPYTSDTIQFTDTSVDSDGAIISWSWSFGDGTTSTQQHATHKYSDDGEYIVTLNVTDDDGAENTIAKLLSIRNVPPLASFDFEPGNPEKNEIVYFNSTSYDSDGTISNYTWDFGDGNKSYTQKTIHQYSEHGTYNVTLNVTDDDGDTDTIQQTILVSPNDPPYPPSNPTPSNASDNISLVVDLSWTGGDPNGDTVTYDVYFGNTSSPDKMMSNQSSTIYNPGTMDFNTTYYWRIVAWDSHGEYTIGPTWHFTTRPNHAPTATPDTYSIDEDTILSVAAPGVLENDVDSDDDPLTAIKVNNTIHGSLTLNSNGSLNYIPNANYYGNDTFSYKAYDGFVYSNVVNVTITIHPVNDPPIFGTPTPANGSIDRPLGFTWGIPINDIEGDRLSWAIQCSNGQNNNGTDETNGTKTLELSGLTDSTTYTVWVNATDSNQYTREWFTFKTQSAGGSGGSGGGGGGGGAAPPSEPENKKPVANVSAGEPYNGYVNSEITFDGSKSYDPDGNITTWSWMFGDGTNGSGKIVSHIYVQTGTYNVSLTVTDNKGATDTTTTVCIVSQPNRPPTQPVISGPTKGPKNTNHTYTVVSTDPDNDTLQYTVDWGDPLYPSQSSGFLPNGISYSASNSWKAAGRYEVTVTVTDNQTIVSSGLTVYIDAVQVGDIGYLLDNDGDGTYDAFYSDILQQITSVEKKNGNYNIDSNGDGKWDHSFNAVLGLTLYQQPETPGFELIFVLSAIALVILVWRKKRRI